MIELTNAELRRRYDPNEFAFRTTEDVPDVEEFIGQERAVAAVEFGVTVKRDGYNIFAHGAPGTGKRTLVHEFLTRRARTQPVPPDLCYVHNFHDPQTPTLLSLPPGTGVQLRQDMVAFADEVGPAMVSAFESEEFQSRRQVIEDEFKEQPEQAFGEIERRAEEEGLRLLKTPVGLAFAPMREGDVLSNDDFNALPEKEQTAIQEKVESFQEEAQRVLRQLPKWNRERHEKLRRLTRDVASLAVAHLIEALIEKYAAHEAVLAFLEQVKQDVTEHAREFLDDESPASMLKTITGGQDGEPGHALRRYQVNLLVDSARREGAPVVYEDHPTYDNLIGRIEHVSHMGTLATDHTHIKAGALHRANGGYLILDADKLIRTPYTWDALKRALRAGWLRVEPLGQSMSLVSTVSLEPQRVELDLQVVLLGAPWLYYLLCEYDPDFEELFKVAADFDDRIPSTEAHREGYVRLIASLARSNDVKPLDRTAVARLLEEGARIVDDQQKLTARARELGDLVREADYCRAKAGAEHIQATHIEDAVTAREHRSDRLRERYQELVQRGTIRITTEGRHVGQINGLSVLTLGRFQFGHPSRISARVRLGEGDVVDIQREVKMGGPIHSKGVLILEGFLGAHYSPSHPLSLSATLAFEQTYTGVDGDSASTAELLCLLSAITNSPLRQDLAITGSVNQHGDVQAIGGINEKIEGFFDICAGRGLTGTQGVVMPAANVAQLMLRQRVVDAVEAGTFHVYAIETVDDAISLFTGMEAGTLDTDGAFPEGSFNALVCRRLQDFAEERRAFRHTDGPDSGGSRVEAANG